jgi:glycerol-3-phosphate dehydrogenase
MLLPGVQPDGLLGGVKYWDGQFNDARLAMALARTAALHGALLLNYCEARDLQYQQGMVSGLVCKDAVTDTNYAVRSRCVVNATGVWVDALREKDGVANARDGRRATRPMVAPSQGVHIVVDRAFLGGDVGLMVPKTADGRVLFAVPWLGKVILGTTDTPRHDLAREPLPFREEVDFILAEAGRYLHRAPTRKDIRSIWVGLRPLVKPQEDDGENTKGLSREHIVLVSRSGLVTVTGGKWTTYRAMAEDVLERCATSNLLPRTRKGVTARLPLVGAVGLPGKGQSICLPEGLHTYGSEQTIVAGMPGFDHWLSPGLCEAMVRFAARFEYAVTVEDMLARRSRMLFLDAALATSLATKVGNLLFSETGISPRTEEFIALAQQYLHVED